MEPLFPYQKELASAMRAGYLIHGFIQRSLTLEEEEELDRWILASDDNMELFEKLTSTEAQESFVTWYEQTELESRLRQSKERLGIGTQPNRQPRIWGLMAAAVVLLLGISVVAWYVFFANDSGKKRTSQDQQSTEEGSSVFITLANGRQITLDQLVDTALPEGLTLHQGVVNDKPVLGARGKHSIRTSRQGLVRLVLPDGSIVWLSGGSSLLYDASFSNSERRITLTGEAYFEVARDSARPFIVEARGIEVKALGTAFNVVAYENFETALLEGSIQVSDQSTSKRLQPRQILSVTDSGWTVSIATRPEDSKAWTRNEFVWNSAPLDDVLQTLGRWYDVEFNLEKPLDIHLNGTIARNVSLPTVLLLLEKTGQVHFTIAGRNVTVRP